MVASSRIHNALQEIYCAFYMLLLLLIVPHVQVVGMHFSRDLDHKMMLIKFRRKGRAADDVGPERAAWFVALEIAKANSENSMKAEFRVEQASPNLPVKLFAIWKHRGRCIYDACLLHGSFLRYSVGASSHPPRTLEAS